MKEQIEQDDTRDRKNYVTAPRMRYEREQVWFPLSEDILGWDDDFHELMLRDYVRMVAYEKAIKEAVKPGMTIADIGTGTGILALWALEAGASKVYGIDVNKNRIPQALERIRGTGYEDRFEVFNALSYDVNLPERVDVVISEILGNLGDNEDMCRILNDARSRFLKKGGIMLPRRVRTSLVPVCSTIAHQQVKDRNCRGINSNYKLDDLLKKLGVTNQFDLYYDAILPFSTYLSEPQVVRDFRFDGNDGLGYSVDASYIVVKEGLFTGFKGSFVADLSDKTCLDISGDDIEGRTTADCWKHCYLPIENPIEVKAGDKIELIYSRYYPKEGSSPFRQCYSWNGKVNRDGRKVSEFKQDIGGENAC